AAHVVIDGSRSNLNRLARLVISLRAGAGDLSAHVARQKKHDGTRDFVCGLSDGPGLFKILLQLERVALNGKVQIADDEARDDFTHRAAGEINIHLVSAGDLRHQRYGALLVRRKPGFHEVDKVSHQVRTTLLPSRHLAGELTDPLKFFVSCTLYKT